MGRVYDYERKFQESEDLRQKLSWLAGAGEKGFWGVGLWVGRFVAR